MASELSFGGSGEGGLGFDLKMFFMVKNFCALCYFFDLYIVRNENILERGFVVVMCI